MMMKHSSTAAFLSTSCMCLVLLAACGGDGGLESRFVAVHNTMSAMGLAQTGAISAGSLAEGDDVTLDQEFAPGECYTIVALGSSSVDDLDVVVRDEAGEEVASDSTRGREAAVQFCPERAGAHQVVVRMAEGDGGYTVSSWSGGVGGASTARGSGGGSLGTCQEPIDLVAGQPAHGTTAEGQARMTGPCIEGNAPEQVYRIQVEERSQLTAVVSSSYDGAVYLLGACGDIQSALACNDDSPDTTRAQIDATVDPGEYFIVVDGYEQESGEYDLVVQLSALQPVAAICSDATPLTVGQAVNGTTEGTPNYFQATCAGGARSADRVYSLDVPSRSRLRLRQQSSHDGALYVRRACDDPTTEIACNDDFRGENHSLITAVVDPGRYFVFSDGFGNGQAGTYTLEAELTADGGGGATGEACAAPGTAVVGQEVEIDTFEARDDLSGSCGGGGGPDVVYEVSVRARSRIRVNVNDPEFGGAVYLQSTCGDTSAEVACQRIELGTNMVLDATVGRGTYYVVLDGGRADAFGSAKVTVQVDDLAALNAMCRRAPRIRPGQTISGSTASESDDFQATCAGGAQSNDLVYRLTLRRRQIVRATMESDYDGALHIRRDCADQSTEIMCNDDLAEGDNRHSLLETTLDAGTYFVIVDGFAAGNAGTFTLDVETSNP